MSKEIGKFFFGEKIPGKLKNLLKKFPLLCAPLVENKGLFLKLNVKELLATYSNTSDEYSVEWNQNDDLIITFTKEGGIVEQCVLRKILPEGFEFYQQHIGRDMFRNDILNMIAGTAEYSEKFKATKEEVVDEQATEEAGSV